MTRDELLLESSGAPVCEFDEIKVVDDAGDEVPDGEPGELVTRGPYTIRGYYNAPEKNAEAFTADGLYRMGDIVRKRGRYVYTEGRRKDLINRGGEKISCEEIENLIFGLPQVQGRSAWWPCPTRCSAKRPAPAWCSSRAHGSASTS